MRLDWLLSESRGCGRRRIGRLQLVLPLSRVLALSSVVLGQACLGKVTARLFCLADTEDACAPASAQFLQASPRLDALNCMQ